MLTMENTKIARFSTWVGRQWTAPWKIQNIQNCQNIIQIIFHTIYIMYPSSSFWKSMKCERLSSVKRTLAQFIKYYFLNSKLREPLFLSKTFRPLSQEKNTWRWIKKWTGYSCNLLRLVQIFLPSLQMKLLQFLALTIFIKTSRNNLFGKL